MTERDAFGNPIEPTSPSTAPSATPLAGIPAAPVPAPTPAAAAAPKPAPAPAPIDFGAAIPTIPTYGPSRTSWGARFVGLAVFLLFAAPLAIGGYAAYNAFHTAKDAVHGVAITSRGLTSGLTPTTTTGTPKASATASLLHASTLRAALAAARRDPGGRLTLLRVAPDRADLQLARKGGGLTLVQIRADGGRNVIQTPGTPSATIGFARVDVTAPSRLVRRAAKRLGRSTRSIDYVVLTNFAGSGPQWSAYFKGGAAFSGDAHGRITRRIQ